uniref:WD repeat-containing protein 89 n=1 Tax=Caenorhabditis tropicalis TaxID=1561998 RepID=A0A1I7UNT7_9PELO
MWNQTNSPMLQSTFSPELKITKCNESFVAVIGVSRPNGAYYLYDFDSEKSQLIPHVCSCQAKTTEADLMPLYSERQKDLTVIFMYNQVSNKVEQYVCRDEMYRLEQVEDTGLVFNPSSVTQTSVVAILRRDREIVVIEKDLNGNLRKCLEEEGRISQLPSREVITVIDRQIQEMEEDYEEEDEEDSDYSYLEDFENDEDGSEDDEEDEEDVSEDDTEDSEHYDDSNPPFVLTVSKKVLAFNYISKNYESFCYDDKTGDFLPIDCSPDPNQVIESHLYPKYMETIELGTNIFHVYNSLTQKMEKYWFNKTTEGFEEVLAPELVYDSSKDTTATLLVTFIYPNRALIIMKDSEGRLKKEACFTGVNNYIPMPPSSVKTLTKEEKEKGTPEKNVFDSSSEELLGLLQNFYAMCFQ